jgi:hypothetical protein
MRTVSIDMTTRKRRLDKQLTDPYVSKYCHEDIK